MYILKAEKPSAFSSEDKKKVTSLFLLQNYISTEFFNSTKKLGKLKDNAL